MISETPVVRDEIEMLREKVRKLTEFAKAYEQWEADLILSQDSDLIDELTDSLYEGLMEVQRLRNEALAE